MANFIFPIWNGITALAMATFVITRNRKQPANVILALFLLTVAGLEGAASLLLRHGAFSAEVVPGMVLLSLLVLAMTLAVLFTAVFGSESPLGAVSERKWSFTAYGFAAAATLVFCWTVPLKVTAADDLHGVTVLFSPSWRPLFAFTAISMLTVLALMVLSHRRMQGIKRKIYRQATLAISSAALFFLTESVLALIFLSIPAALLDANSIVFMAYQFLFLLAIVGYNLLDTGILSERRFTYRIFVTVVAAVYVLLMAIMSYYGWSVMGNFSVYLMTGIALALSAGAVVALASDRLGSAGRKVKSVSSFSEPHKYEYRERWDSFTLLLSHVDDLPGLCRVILPEIMETMMVKKGTLWLVDEELGRYTCCAVEGVSAPGCEIARDGRILHALAGETGPVTAAGLADRIDPSAVELLENVAADIISPLKVKEKLIGFITLGASWKDANRGFEDYRMLRTLTGQVAVALYRQMLAEKIATMKGLESFARVSSFVVHDLKNAVNMLSMVVQNAAANIHKPEFQKDAVETIGRGTEKIRGIVERLSFSPEAEPKEKRTLLDLNIAIDGVLGRMQLERVPGVTVEKSYGDIAAVDAVPYMIDQLFENLFLNAVQALPGDGGRVSVRTVMNGSGGVVVEVSDTGCGIPAEDLGRRIFRPLHTTKEKGLGIGLYHCRHIVSAHGGTIEAESEIGKGSTFRVRLRAARG